MIEKKTKTGLMMAIIGLLLLGLMTFLAPIITGAQIGNIGIVFAAAGNIMLVVGGILAFIFALIGVLFVAKAAAEPTPVAPPAPAPTPTPAPTPAPAYSPPPAQQPYPQQYPPGQYPPPSPP